MRAGDSDTKERWTQALIFFLILIVGLAISAAAQRNLAHEDRLREYNELRQTAIVINGELGRILDSYQTANESLAAFITASDGVTNRSFEHYVNTANPFHRLPGLGAVGYLPRVPSSDLPAFEAEMRRQFPNFRVWRQPPGATYHYPLAYAVDPQQPDRVEELRGLDFASVNERLAAMTEALQSGKSRATPLHMSARDRPQKKVVLIFTPVYSSTHLHRATSQHLLTPVGLVFSVVFVDELFSFYDRGLVNTKFDIEVFEKTVQQDALIYDGDGSAQRLAETPELQLIYKDQLEFGGQRWLLFMYQKERLSFADVSLSQIIALVLTLLLAYCGVRIHRHYRALKQEAWQAERFSSFFENHPFAVYSLDRSRRFIAVNAKTEEELGVPREQLIGASLDAFLSAENARISQSYFKQALQGKAVSYHNLIRTLDGAESDLSVVLVPMSADGKVTSVLGIAKNVTEKRRAELELHRSRQTLQLVLDNIPQLVFWTNVHGVYQGGNQRMVEFAGLENMQELIGKTDLDMPWREHAQAFMADSATVANNGQPLLKHQEIQVQVDGRLQWLEISRLPMTGLEGEVDSILCVVDDITERKETEAELFMRANYDNLTGLANRAYFYHQLENTLSEHARAPRLMALMYFDIDRFKRINDTYGHHVGDEVIQEFAHRISGVLRSTDVLARLGGDEFILLLRDVHDLEAVEIVARKIIAAMRMPFSVDENSLSVTTSIGIALYKDQLTADQWIKLADAALYDAKNAGRNRYQLAPVSSDGVTKGAGA